MKRPIQEPLLGCISSGVKKLNENTKYQIIDLPNVGRESHTWVYHIYENYESLTENIIFLQGRIDDLGCMAFQDLKKYEEGLEKDVFCASRLGLLTPFHWRNDNLSIPRDIRYKSSWNEGKISRNKLGFRKFSEELFPEISMFVPTSYGGCFAVNSKSVKSYPKSFYLNLINLLDKHQHPIEAHYLERIWCYMFSKNRLLFRAFYDVAKTKLERNFFERFKL